MHYTLRKLKQRKAYSISLCSSRLGIKYPEVRAVAPNTSAFAVKTPVTPAIALHNPIEAGKTLCPTDAMTDTNLEAHNNSIEIIFPRLGETCTTSELTALLEK